MSSSDTPTAPQPPSTGDRPDAAVARRVVLSGLGIGALSVTVAACGSSGSTKAADTTEQKASPSAAETTQQGAAPEGAAALTTLAKIPPGGTVEVTDATGRKLLLTRTGTNTVKALSAKCTHKGCAVVAKGGGKELVCPCHGSVFTPGTGAVQKGPADKPLPAVAVKVQNGSVVLDA